MAILAGNGMSASRQPARADKVRRVCVVVCHIQIAVENERMRNHRVVRFVSTSGEVTVRV